jgi:hypothetical protein
MSSSTSYSKLEMSDAWDMDAWDMDAPLVVTSQDKRQRTLKSRAMKTKVNITQKAKAMISFLDGPAEV